MKKKWLYIALGIVILLIGYSYFSKNKQSYPPLPQQYLDDRAKFAEVTQFFNDAMDLTKPPDNSGQPFNMPKGQETQILSKLESGIALSKEIGDSFLDYLDPEMRDNYRNKYIAGYDLILAGLKDDTSNKNSIGVKEQMDGNKLIGDWDVWWNKNKDNITNKAFAK